MRVNMMITSAESGPLFGWFNTSTTSMDSFAGVAERFSRHGSTVLHMRFQGETTLEHRTEVFRNYLALLSKSWKFLFPACDAPGNPWISGMDVSYEVLNDHPGAVKTAYEDGYIEIRMGQQTPNGLVSLVWRLGNAFEWCMLPDRRRLSGRLCLSRETWDAISVQKRADVLRRETRPTQENVAPTDEAPPVPQSMASPADSTNDANANGVEDTF